MTDYAIKTALSYRNPKAEKRINLAIAIAIGLTFGVMLGLGV